MRYISLFSGIEAASVAWRDLDGFEPVAFCEIDAFPSAVLAYRFPDIPNLGDITRVNWKEVLDEHGTIDLIVGGSPCQSFSIAGGRESLDGESRLMFEYIRAIHDVRPKWLLWENVPGVLSTRDNAFAQLLEELSKLGYGLAWRSLDAQFFGVAQRRNRVFVVGLLGAGGGSAAVLFDRESVRGNTLASKEKRARLAEDSGRSAALGFKYHQGANARTLGIGQDVSPTLTIDHNPVVCVEECIALQTDGSTSRNQHGCGYQTDGSAYTLNLVDRQSVVCMVNDTSNAAVNDDLAGTLLAGGGFAAADCIGPLCARDYKGVSDEYVDEGKVICERTRSK